MLQTLTAFLIILYNVDSYNAGRQTTSTYVAFFSTNYSLHSQTLYNKFYSFFNLAEFPTEYNIC